MCLLTLSSQAEVASITDVGFRLYASVVVNFTLARSRFWWHKFSSQRIWLAAWVGLHVMRPGPWPFTLLTNALVLSFTHASASCCAKTWQTFLLYSLWFIPVLRGGLGILWHASVRGIDIYVLGYEFEVGLTPDSFHSLNRILRCVMQKTDSNETNLYMSCVELEGAPRISLNQLNSWKRRFR